MKLKRILGGIVALLVAAVSVSTPFAASATEGIDFSKTGTIHIALESSGTISAYYVASILSNCEYEYVENCEESGIDLADLIEGDAESAQDMAEWCVDSDLVPVTVEISGNSVTFDDLDLGLYIIIQEEAGEEYYPILPFAVTVPANVDGAYDYAVDATPKVETEVEGAVTDKDDDSSSARTQNEDDTDVEGDKDTPGGDSDSSSARANGSGGDDESSSSRITGGGSDTAGANDTDDGDSSSITGGGSGDSSGDGSGDGVSSEDSIVGDTNDASNNGGGVYGIISAGSSLNGGDSGDAGTLPQTGQLQWPIPVFGACGLFLILLGGTIRFATRRRAYQQNGAQ